MRRERGGETAKLPEWKQAGTAATAAHSHCMIVARKAGTKVRLAAGQPRHGPAPKAAQVLARALQAVAWMDGGR